MTRFRKRFFNFLKGREDRTFYETLARHAYLSVVHLGGREFTRNISHRNSKPVERYFLSSASVWESVIKNAAGKLPLPMPPAVYLPQQRVAHHMASLAIDEGAMPFLAALPLIHRDPFDRILVAQNQQRGLTMLSVDPQVRAYPIPCLPY